MASMVVLFGCKDDGSSPIDSNNENSVPATFTKKVVVEKFTGEWCGFCPGAGKFFDDMHDKYGDKFLGVSVHAGSAHDRYKDNPACKAMYSSLVSKLRHPNMTTIGFPNVMFNRNKNAANNQVINGYGSSDWESKLQEELAEPASCGVSITSTLNGNTLVTTVSYHLKEELVGDYGITAYVLENNLDGSEQVSAPAGYTHQHVLRGLLTPETGLIVDGSSTNTTITLELDDFDISDFKKDDLEIVAFIHKNGSTYSDREVLNGQTAKIGTTAKFD